MKAERTTLKCPWDFCASEKSKNPQHAQDLDSVGSDKNQVDVMFWPLSGIRVTGCLMVSQHCQIRTAHTRYILVYCHAHSVSDWGFFPLKQVVVAGLEPMGALCRHTLWKTLLWIRPMIAIPGRPFCAMPKQLRTTHTGFLQHIPSKRRPFKEEILFCLTNWEEHNNGCFEALTSPFLVLFLSVKIGQVLTVLKSRHLFAS